jgi:hypothetical protein
MDYEGIMDITMKTICVLGISNRHNIHNLKNRQNCTSAVAQVNVHNLPNAHKVPKCPACTEQAMPNQTSPRVCQLPKGAGVRLAGLNKLFFWDLILVNQC